MEHNVQIRPSLDVAIQRLAQSDIPSFSVALRDPRSSFVLKFFLSTTHRLDGVDGHGQTAQ
jgi:hypothetical protein